MVKKKMALMQVIMRLNSAGIPCWMSGEGTALFDQGAIRTTANLDVAILSFDFRAGPIEVIQVARILHCVDGLGISNTPIYLKQVGSMVEILPVEIALLEGIVVTPDGFAMAVNWKTCVTTQ
jgi:hypothetical protein